MRLTKDQYFCSMLSLVASRSTCVRRAIAAIVVDGSGHILSTGYNGPPQGLPHCTKESPCEGANDPKGDSSRCMAVHSEINALLQCNDLRSARVLYCSASSCFSCAKAIANTPIERVVFLEVYSETRGLKLLLDAGKICQEFRDGEVKPLSLEILKRIYEQ